VKPHKREPMPEWTGPDTERDWYRGLASIRGNYSQEHWDEFEARIERLKNPPPPPSPPQKKGFPEFNPSQPRDQGRWTSGGDSGDEGKKHPGKGYTKNAYVKGGVIYTSDVRDAARALHEDRKVELDQPRKVSILLDHLGQVTENMIEMGEKAPVFDLCNVVIKNTSLFCVESHDIPRIDMPQLRGKAGDMEFRAYLAEHYKVEDTTHPAAYLRPTQNQINGGKVASMANAMRRSSKLRDRRVFISRDDYIIDGHHTWAAKVGLDSQDNILGQEKMNVTRVDLDVISLLEEAHKFSGPRQDIDKRLKAVWDEGKHPRGQPANAGQFGPGGGGTTEAASTQVTAPAVPQEPGLPDINGSMSYTAKHTDQTIADIEELYTTCKAGEAGFRSEIESIAEATGGKPIYPPEGSAEPGTKGLKNKISVERKLKEPELQGDVSKLRDILRATVVHDTVAESRLACAKFMQQFGDRVVRVKDRFADGRPEGYRDMLVNFKTKEGVVTEVQFNSDEMLKTKFGEGHKIYAKIRVLDAVKDEPVLRELKAESKRIYDEAYQKDGDGQWGVVA
jgi:hypothetical protein